jgi:flagellum-specific peptidoglycan hydrolase FlgJ
MTLKEFINTYVSHANRIAEIYKIPSLVTLSQAAWESGCGNHAPAFNFFGITAGATWKGDVQYLNTTEYKNGQKVKVKRAFRAYANPLLAFSDYANIITSNNNYRSAFNYINDPELFFKKIFEGGYATDPNYERNVLTIMSMIKKYVK